jgi:predicted transcriptional regulator
MSRKMPCELVVFELLPTARGSIAKTLVDEYGYTQTKVAEVFGVTNVAISQYVKGLRGGNKYIEGSIYKDDFYAKVSEISRRIALENGDLSVELCELCRFFKDSGMINEIYQNQGSMTPLSKCGECPRQNF